MVYIGNQSFGPYTVAPFDTHRYKYAGVDSGPVRVVSTNHVPILAALRTIWGTGYSDLMGYPVEEEAGMPDAAADSLSVAFGNFERGYTITDRMGTRILRDPFTNKPYVHFYTTKRVGGGVTNSEAIKLLKFAAS